jgi:hypothetical protein
MAHSLRLLELSSTIDQLIYEEEEGRRVEARGCIFARIMQRLHTATIATLHQHMSVRQ